MLARPRHPALIALLFFALLFATTLRAGHVHLDGDGHPVGNERAHCSICSSLDRSPAPPLAFDPTPLFAIEFEHPVPTQTIACPSARNFGGANRPRGPPTFR